MSSDKVEGRSFSFFGLLSKRPNKHNLKNPIPTPDGIDMLDGASSDLLPAPPKSAKFVSASVVLLKKNEQSRQQEPETHQPVDLQKNEDLEDSQNPFYTKETLEEKLKVVASKKNVNGGEISYNFGMSDLPEDDESMEVVSQETCGSSTKHPLGYDKEKKVIIQQTEDSLKKQLSVLSRNICSGEQEEFLKNIQSFCEKHDINQKDSETGATLLGLAITMLQPEIVKTLLELGADPNLETGLKGKETRLPLVIALGKSSPSDPKSLYESNAPEPKKADSKISYSEQRKKILKFLLLNEKLDHKKQDKTGKSAIDWCNEWNCKNTDRETYKIINMKDSKEFVKYYEKEDSIALTDCIKNKTDEECLSFIKNMDIKNHLSFVDPESKHTPLGLAITLLKPKTVSFLLDSGADPNQPTGNKEYHLPITLALGKSHSSVLDRSKEKTTKSVFSCPRLSMFSESTACSCQSDRVKIIDDILARKNFDINKKEKDGKNCIDWFDLWSGFKTDLSTAEKLKKLLKPSDFSSKIKI